MLNFTAVFKEAFHWTLSRFVPIYLV